jgi:hypothetical protein
VQRLLNRATPPSQEYVRHRHVPRLVEPFLPYLLQRWADGFRNGRQLTRGIEQLGYLGKGYAVRWMIARWRPPKTRGQPKRRLLTRHVPWLLEALTRRPPLFGLAHAAAAGGAHRTAACAQLASSTRLRSKSNLARPNI